MKRLPELLAPAGNLEAAVAAFESGADAVYAGYGKFNARERADNFTQEDMSRLAAYTKARGKHFYLTFNTLMKESEIPEALHLIEGAAQLEPDALILQDLGLARAVCREFPQLVLHSSTQMGLHNSAGLELAADLGLSRVILERQIDLKELESLSYYASTMKPPIELEVFIHGALCCSLSGRCLFSSWIGGWSGNRGRCKQPCRRRYHTMDSHKKESGFFFSTQDLYSLNLIGRYIRWGLSSLKIEGRLKKPDYIRSVVRAYRLVLDAPDPDDSRLQGEARLILSGSYGRRWSNGFATHKDRSELIQHESLGVSGQLIGEVLKISSRGIEVKANRPLHRGDRIRIQSRRGDEGPALTATALILKGQSRPTAPAGSRVFIPIRREETREDIPAQGLVFRIGESRSDKPLNREAMPLFQPTFTVALDIELTEKGFSISLPDYPWIPPWNKALKTEEARSHGLDHDKIKELFSATRENRITPQFHQITIEDDFFIPPSQLKKIRREFWETIIPQLSFLWNNQAPEKKSAPENPHPLCPSPYSKDKSCMPPLHKGIPLSQVPAGHRLLAPLEDYSSQLSDDEMGRILWELPYFCAEEQLSSLKKSLTPLFSRTKANIRITAPYQIALIRRMTAEKPSPSPLHLTAGFPLPLCNSEAVKLLQDWLPTLEGIQAWVEMEKNSVLELLKKSPLPIEIYRHGHPLLLTTRAALIPRGDFTDSRGKTFTAEKPDPRDLPAWKTPLQEIFPGDILERPPLPNTSDFFDHSRDSPQVKKTSGVQLFNWEKEWM